MKNTNYIYNIFSYIKYHDIIHLWNNRLIISFFCQIHIPTFRKLVWILHQSVIWYLFSICNLEMLTFCESSTTLSSSQGSPDKMHPDFRYSSNTLVLHHLSTELTDCNSLPSADHALPWQLSSYIPMKSYSMHRLQSFLTLSPNFRSAHQ